jgi:hypothetical protein
VPIALADFGTRTRREDSVVHFCETFLAAYDPELRETRGVYYTPEPVVSYIVRSIDHLLKDRFGLGGELADRAMVTYERTNDAGEAETARVPRRVDPRPRLRHRCVPLRPRRPRHQVARSKVTC